MGRQECGTGCAPFSPASPRAFPRGQRRFWPFPHIGRLRARPWTWTPRRECCSTITAFQNTPTGSNIPRPARRELAGRVRDLLAKAALPCDGVTGRGFDHGVFIPFMLIYPQADMPILQMSLQKHASVAEHLAIGRALAPLREEGVLIVGSGMSYHNLREFFSPSDAAREPAAQFDDWLLQAVEAAPQAREAALIDWRKAPGAKQSHPTPEHLAPLFVVAGAAGEDAGRRVFSGELAGKPVSGFRFG